ncbi:hypothetical protein ACG83_31200 [Frankia sp. R43]|uniref:hypothetical protein n=1 Tax=Frankia sp. R43 TaxID=269536 RepID=UPI0006CA47CC|nr:hypothetical protein [Frankia sp. R43]KPM52024.1 hypothetical protein ACG83_31200 [Frankia sp. R43]
MADDEAHRLPDDLRSFLDDDSSVDDRESGLAHRAFFVEEQVLGKNTSRFVAEGGVQFNSVQVYALTPENLPPMASLRRGLAERQLELLKFRFTIDLLPPGRSYVSVSVRITVQSPVTVLMLQPHLDTADTDLEKTSNSEAALEVARLVQVHLTRSHGNTARRTEHLPVTTALDLGPRGFGWTFEAREGAPLFSRTVLTHAMIEVPRGTPSLSGLFDAEALIIRRVLNTSIRRPAKPANSAAPFTVDLTAAPCQSRP